MTTEDDETEVEVVVSRPGDGCDEITITVTISASATEPKKRLYVTLTPADFALALTGRGGIKGRLSQFVLQQRKQ